MNQYKCEYLDKEGNTMWKEALKEACAEQSQAKIAKQLGYSSATISLFLKGTYKGSEKNLQEAVEKHLLKVTVICPILGEITKLECSYYQQKPFSCASRQSVEIFKACKNCKY